MIYNSGQEKIIQEAVHHILYGDNLVYQYSGGPGTGKTTVLMEIIRRIGIPLHRIAPMAYIGQAAIVMRTKGLYNAKTIHSWLYEPVEVPLKDEKGNVIYDTTYNVPIMTVQFIPRDLNDIDYFIIDEGGTVPLSMKKDIESRGKKIIVCGDANQLPPVGDAPAYLHGGRISYLTETMRQGHLSTIPIIANMVLRGITPATGLYGNVLVIERKDLTDEMLRYTSIVLCGTNRTRDSYNSYIRQNIFGIYTKLPQYGEKVICRKNNWSSEVNGISLANGLMGRVVKSPRIDTFDGKIFTMDFKPNLLDSYFPDLRVDYEYFISPKERRDVLRNSKYSIGEKFEYAYASTTHLSQGSEYPIGIYIKEFLGKDIQCNLDYTAVTRFKNYLIYVIPNSKSKYW